MCSQQTCAIFDVSKTTEGQGHIKSSIGHPPPQLNYFTAARGTSSQPEAPQEAELHPLEERI